MLFVDISPEQENSLSSVVTKHSSLKAQGTGDASPGWVIHGRDKYHAFMKARP